MGLQIARGKNDAVWVGDTRIEILGLSNAAEIQRIREILDERGIEHNLYKLKVELDIDAPSNVNIAREEILKDDDHRYHDPRRQVRHDSLLSKRRLGSSRGAG